MAPSALYKKMHALAQMHAVPDSMGQLLAIRAPDAVHSWGHNYLVSRHPTLADRMDNAAFLAHLKSTGLYLGFGGSQIHDIIVDEQKRQAVVRMSYFLMPQGSEETVEHDLIWLLKFTDDEDAEVVLIRESVEFIDAAASARLGTVIRSLHGDLEAAVRGGITL
jgi:hypothetical protein